MSSVYFPAHVVVLFRRLVNVVSTLSISNQYVLHNSTTNDTTSRLSNNTTNVNGSKESSNDSLKYPYDYLRSIQWYLWSHRSNVEEVDVRKQIATEYGTILKAAIELPRWIPGNWSWPSLFLTPETEPNSSSYNHNLSPDMPPNPVPEDQPPRRAPPRIPTEVEHPPDIIHQLLENPALLDPIRTPRYPIVLCHGLYGFDSRGPSTFPSMRMHYWSNVLNILRGMVGADVIVTSVPGTGSIYSRAAKLDEQLQLRARGRGINFLAHSMGGLDCRHLISHIRPQEYAPLSLTSISTPHRGSAFMDWCESNIGIGKLRQQEEDRKIQNFISESEKENSSSANTKSSSESSFTMSFSSLPSSFTTLLLSVVDSPAYANLTSNYLNNVFNPNTPDNPRVKYWSVAGRMSADSVSVWHPFWLPKMVLDGVEEKERERLKKRWEEQYRSEDSVDEIPFWADERQWGNDGLVTIQSAKWGEFLGTMEGCDHWEMRGARGIEFGVDIPAIPAIGLGSLPLASSLANLTRTSPDKVVPTAQGDGWGFGDWTHFVGAWKKNKDQEAAADRAGSVHKHHKHGVEEARAHDASMNSSLTSSSFPSSSSSESLSMTSSSSSPSSPSLSATVTTSEKFTNQPERQSRKTASASRNAEGEDAVVKQSTDTLSVVFDWLIERVPAPGVILRRSDNGKGKEKQNRNHPEASSTTTKSTDAEATGGNANGRKEFGAFAVTHPVDHNNNRSSSHSPRTTSGSSSSPPSSPPSEMKRRMEREDKGRRKQRELATKEDLQRFYIALARKMYDAGL